MASRKPRARSKSLELLLCRIRGALRRGTPAVKVAVMLASLSSLTALALLLELLVRITLPGIKFQDTEHALFRENAFGSSVGWQPGTAGISFGETVEIDASGFRRIPEPLASREQWLVLGDSVTFGVGVKAEETFVGLLKQRFPEVSVRSAAVVGYSVLNHRDVLGELLRRGQHFDRIILCYCLNDIDGYFTSLPRGGGSWLERGLGLLRRHSKLYVLAKAVLADRSQAYFNHDRTLYAEKAAVDRVVQTLDEIHRMALRMKARFTVVILPYEYQLRQPDPSNLLPQEVLAQRLHALGIPHLDAFDAFRSAGHDGRALFLYGDAMHLSVAGHQVALAALLSGLNSPNLARAGSLLR